MALAVFPVAASGKPSFSNDFGAPRSGGRTHEGTDIFAARGTPVLAVDDGQVSQGEGKTPGLFAELQAVDGVRYFYAHLDAFEGGERTVNAGDVIGFVGDTGNAKGLLPHLHFEVHPTPDRGPGTAINPFPLLAAMRGVSSSPATPAPQATPRGEHRRSGGGLWVLAAAFTAWYLWED